jgi:hypothetical protein
VSVDRRRAVLLVVALAARRIPELHRHRPTVETLQPPDNLRDAPDAAAVQVGEVGREAATPG